VTTPLHRMGQQRPQPRPILRQVPAQPAPVKQPAPRLADPWLTISEVATQLRVSTMTAYRLCERGELRAKRVGRSLRIRQSWFDAYLEDTE
jgi:excisionase family DNA binding protein